ncbi:MAG: class I SAM-dependent methyltransferase [Pseudomonadota bacterium]
MAIPVQVVWMAVRTYETLQGEQGARAVFRAERHNADRLFDGQPPQVNLAGHDMTLIDMSRTGLGVVDQGGVDISLLVGRQVPVRLTDQNRGVLSALAHVVRSERVPDGTRLGLALKDTLIDPQEVARDVASHRKVAGLKTSVLSQPEACVSTDYKALCLDVLAFLQTIKSTLSSKITEEPDGEGAALRASMFGLCESVLIPRWRALCERANSLVSPDMPQPVLEQTKQLTERLLAPAFMQGPIWRRAYEKPLGYPGDHEVMAHVYDWEWRGDSLYGQILHRLGLEVMACVRSRMDVVEDLIRREMAVPDRHGPLRIANIGCGSAQEISNLLVSETLDTPLDITLIDQGFEPLDFALKRARPLQYAHGDAVQLTGLQVSFAQLMKAHSVLSDKAPYDVIYSIGLFDYLKTRRAQRLTAALFERVAPGGLLIIGNLRSRPLGRWSAEFITDWSMIYRHDEEIISFADGLDAIDKTLVVDRLEEVGFICLRKGS